MLGLLELGFVLAIALALGLHQLWTLRRDRRARQAARPPSDAAPPVP